MDDYDDWSDSDLLEEINDRCCARNEWEEDFIEDLVNSSPSLTHKQWDKIVELLRRDDAQN